MQNKLIAMNQKAHVILRKYSFSTDWTCEVECKDERLAFKITQNGDTPEQAVDAAFIKWQRVISAVPEFIGMLAPSQITEDAVDADQYRVDDDIPF